MSDDQDNFTSSGLRGASKEAAAEQKKVKSAFKGNVNVTPSALLDEARMREILAEELDRANMTFSAARIRGQKNDGHLMTMEGLNACLAAMSRAISEARAEQRELDAGIMDVLALAMFDGPMRLAMKAGAAAIRSQDNPNKS